MEQVAFTTLEQAVELYYDELRHHIQKQTGSASIAEEVIQETWIRAKNTQRVLPDNPRAYLYRMTSNLSIDYLRKQQVQNRFTGKIDDIDEIGLEQIASDAPGPDDIHAAREELALLFQAIDELPARYKEAFVLYRSSGLTKKQVAMQLRISEKTVEKHIAKAMLFCRQRLMKK